MVLIDSLGQLTTSHSLLTVKELFRSPCTAGEDERTSKDRKAGHQASHHAVPAPLLGHQAVSKNLFSQLLLQLLDPLLHLLRIPRHTRLTNWVLFETLSLGVAGWLFVISGKLM